MHSTDQYDVAILGAGFEGSLLGTILAYKGARVLILDAGVHPRFALGESTVRHTFRMMKIMGERFGVPELKEKFSSGEILNRHVSSGFGVKKNFGFIYHREGEHQRPDECTQLIIPPFREGYEAHLFRQDTDAFLTHTALHHGATVKYRTPVTGVDINGQGVTIHTATGGKFQSRFILDGSGGGQVLPKLFNLMDKPPRLRVNTRCLFTHMIDVKPYDDLNLPHGVPRMPKRWYEGTCHHLFDGGWLWVIPFNNREGSTNPLVSVGLSYDIDRFPKPEGMTPEQEWDQFLQRFPSIYEQFKDAKPARDWVSSGRLQTSCKQTVGERWALLASVSGAGFLDALFSRGLATSTEIINALAARVLQALKEDEFSPARFDYVAQLHENNLMNNDRLVKSSYTAFRDFNLWNAWFRIWALGVGIGDLRLASIYRRYKVTHDESILPDAEEPMGLFFSNNPTFQRVFNDAVAKMTEVEQGRADTKSAAAHILKLIGESNLTPPSNGLADPAKRYHGELSLTIVLRTLGWLFRSAPPEIRKLGFGVAADLKPNMAGSQKSIATSTGI